MRCKNCGNEVKSDYKYCPFCATRLMQDFNDHFAELEPPILSIDSLEDSSDIFYEEEAKPKPEKKPSYTVYNPNKGTRTKNITEMEDEIIPHLITFDMPEKPKPIKKSPNLEMDEERISSAPYVSMKPEIEHETKKVEVVKGPSPVFKILLIVFILLFAILTSFAVYWLTDRNHNKIQSSDIVVSSSEGVLR